MSTHLELEFLRGLTVQQRSAVEIGDVGDPIDLASQALHLLVDEFAFLVTDGVGSRLHAQFAHTNQHVADLVQAAFGNLDERDAVAGVALRLTHRADLRTQVFADGQSGGVIACRSDPVTGSEFLEGLRLRVRCTTQGAVGRNGRHIRRNSQAHVTFSYQSGKVGLS